MKRKLWHNKLTKGEKRHIRADAGCSLVSIRSFRKVIEWQKENNRETALNVALLHERLV